MENDKSEVIAAAFHTRDGFQEMSLAAVVRTKNIVLTHVENNGIPDLTEYAQACHFRDLVFSVIPEKPGMTWETSLVAARIRANNRLRVLADAKTTSKPYREASNRTEMAAILDFLDRTRALVY